MPPRKSEICRPIWTQVQRFERIADTFSHAPQISVIHLGQLGFNCINRKKEKNLVVIPNISVVAQTSTKRMAFSSSSLVSKNRHAIRSISLPTRSHPSTLQVEEELTNFKTWETSISCVPDAGAIYCGLTNLGRLYTCVENLLSLPLTQQALSHHQYEKLVDELRDRWMRLLDICGSVKDIVSQVKEQVRYVQSALRRRKGDFVIDASFLKKLTKDAKRRVADLKQIDHTYGSKPLNLDPHLSLVIRMLRDVNEVSIFVFEMLLSFLSVSISKSKSATKWSIVSRFIQRGAAGSKDQSLISVEALDCSIEGIENGLECMFRKLIRTRASLLNILSH